MEGFSREYDQVDIDLNHPFEKLDETPHPSEESDLKPEENYAFSLDKDEAMTLLEGSNSDNQVYDLNHPFENLNESYLKPEENDASSIDKDEAMTLLEGSNSDNQVYDLNYPFGKLDETPHPSEESDLKPEENYASSLDKDEAMTLLEGSNSDNQVYDLNHPFENLDESYLKPEENDASSLNKDEAMTLLEGSNSDNQVYDMNYPFENLDESSQYLSEESDLKPEENDASSLDKDDDFPLEEATDSDAWNRYYYDHQLRLYAWNHDYYYDQSGSSACFERDYRCFPLSFIDKTRLEIGNKIIMPAEALKLIMESTQISMPMQFEIHNLFTGKVSHCGVFEFTGEEDDAVFLPDWMMKNMQLQEGDFMYMKNKRLEKGTYIKLQPHTSDFLGIWNPKAVLEENLQKFSCLTMGDTIMISHGSKNFYINIVETKPSDAINIIDTDCNVDFAPPLDYKEPEKRAAKGDLEKEQEEATQKPQFKPFTGLARRLDEKPCSKELDSASLPNEQPSAAEAKPMSKRSTEGLVFQPDRNQPRNKGKELTSENLEAETLKKKPKFQPFTGKKYTLTG